MQRRKPKIENQSLESQKSAQETNSKLELLLTESQITGTGLFEEYKNNVSSQIKQIFKNYLDIKKNEANSRHSESEAFGSLCAAVGGLQCLRELLHQSNDTKYFFFIFAEEEKDSCSKGKFQWAIAVIINEKYAIKVLHKNIASSKIETNLKTVLKESFKGKTIKFITNKTEIPEDSARLNGSQCCLTLFKIILKNLIDNKSNFIENFKDYPFDYETEKRLTPFHFDEKDKKDVSNFLILLDKILKFDSNYFLPDHTLKNLTECLKIEYQSCGDEDTRIQILQSISNFKKTGRSLDNVKDSIKEFYNGNKDLYLSKIRECSKQFLNNSRQKLVENNLAFSVSNGIKFLINIHFLIPEELNVNFLVKFILLICEDVESITAAKEKIKKLERKLNRDIVQYHSIIKKIESLEHKINFYKFLAKINEENNASRLVIVVKNVIRLDNELDAKVINWIVRSSVNREELVIAAINVLIALPKDTTIDANLNEIFAKLALNSKNFKLVLTLCLKVRFSKPCVGLVSLLLKILELEDYVDSEVLQVLDKLKDNTCNPKDLRQEVSELIDLENICAKSDRDSCLQVFLNRVKQEKKLTFNCFKKCCESLDMSKKLQDIISGIVETNKQKLPAFMVNELKKLAQNSEKPEIIAFCKPLIECDYILLSDIANLEKFVSDKEFESDVLDIIHIAFQKGQTLSSDLIDNIKKLPDSSYKTNVLNRIEGIETDIDVLINSRKSINERQKAADNIVKNKNTRNQYSAKILQNLIVFDKEIRVIAFHALVIILEDNDRNFKYDLNYQEILIAINDCKFDLDDLSAIIKHVKETDVVHVVNLLLRTCKLDMNIEISLSCLKELCDKFRSTQILSETNATFLYEMAKQTPSLSIKIQVIEILERSFSESKIQKIFTNNKFIKLKKTTKRLSNSNMEISVVIRELIYNELKGIAHDGYCISTHQLMSIFSVLDKRICKDDCIAKDCYEKLRFAVSDKIIKAFCADDENSNLKLIWRMQKQLIDSDEKVSKQYLFKIGFLDYLVNLYAEKLDLNNQKINNPIIQNLKIFVFKDTNSFLNKIAFRCLVNLNMVDLNDLKVYYDKLNSELKNLTSDKNDYFEKLNADEKCSLLSTTSAIMLYNGKLDHNALASIDLLSFALLNSTNEKHSKTTIEQFNETFNVLSENIPEKSLQLLFAKQSTFCFDLLTIIDILHFASEFPIFSYKVIEEHFFKADQFLNALKKSWLALKLISCKVEFTHNQLTKLSEIMFENNCHVEIDLKSKPLVIKIKCLINGELKPNSDITKIEKFQTNSIDDLLTLMKLLLDEARSIESNVKIYLNASPDFKPLKNLIVNLHLDFRTLKCDSKNVKMLSQKLFYIYESGWTIESIQKLISHFKEIPNKSEIYLNALDTIYEFRLKEYEFNINGEILIEILNLPVKKWSEKINSLALFRTFSGTKNKSRDQITEELITLNNNNEINFVELKKDIDEIHKCYEQKPKKGNSANRIAVWNETDIKNWVNDAGPSEENVKDGLGSTAQNVEETAVSRVQQVKDAAASGIQKVKDTAASGVQKVKDAAGSVAQKVSDFVFGKDNLCEKIAVVKRAMELITGFSVRDIQLISLLCLLKNEKTKGRLSQINTGEGKTSIVAMLAAIMVLDGHSVDIVTSSPELAKPQSEQQKRFFSLFGFTVSHNGRRTDDNDEDIEKVYEANVVYGAASDFQGDILREEFSKSVTRNGRKFDIAIVDEVDSMLIDGKNHIVMLSSQMPAMEHLMTILAAIWTQLNNVTASIEEKNGNHYFKLDKEDDLNDLENKGELNDLKNKDSLNDLKNKDDLNDLKNKDNLNDLKNKDDLNDLKNKGDLNDLKNKDSLNDLKNKGDLNDLKNKDDLNNLKNKDDLNDLKNKDDLNDLKNKDDLNDLKIEGNLNDFIKTNIENHVRMLLRDEKNLPEHYKPIPKEYPILKIPKHLKNLTSDVQIKKWIDSAIYAKDKCKLGQHYLISEDGKINPVDALNTGVVQQNTNWSNGLHQFLQLKEGTNFVAENLPTNYISNVSYFKRYGKHIYGLTGTLGSKKAREFLCDTYNVDHVIVPPFRKKQHLELKPLVANNESDWYDAIVDSTLNKLSNNRGVLIITNYINEAEIIKDKICKKLYDKSKVKLYITEKDSEVVDKVLEHGEVLIATNIAGRGTDIKTSPTVEKNGGLHVLITFLPSNERVEQQNVGRTSRTGNRGTSQLVLLETKNSNVNALKEKRNCLEEESLRKAKIEIEKVENKDKIFKMFCEFLDGFKGAIEKNEYVKKAIEERFAIWLQTQSVSREDIFESFNEFKKNLTDEGEEKLIKNPSFHVLRGNKYLSSKKYDDAIKEYDKAIELDADYAEYAFYHRAVAKISRLDKCENINELQDEFKDLKDFAKLIKERLQNLHIIELAINSKELPKQLQIKNCIYNSQLNAIEHAIGCDADEINKAIEHFTELLDKLNSKTTAIKNRFEELKSARGNIDTSKTEDVIRCEEEELNEKVKQLDEAKLTVENCLNSCKQKKGKESEISKLLNEKKKVAIVFLDSKQLIPSSEDAELFEDNLKHFENEGFMGIVQVSESKHVPWYIYLSIAAMGIAKMIIGGLVHAYVKAPIVAGLGMKLIRDGFEDILATVRGYVSKAFDWKTYLYEQAISYAVSITAWGMDTALNWLKNSEAFKKLKRNSFTKAVTFFQEVFKDEKVVKMANCFTNYLATEYIINRLKGWVDGLVRPELTRLLDSNKKVQRMIEMDCEFLSNKCQTKIKDDVQNDILSENCGCEFHFGRSIFELSIGRLTTSVLKSETKSYLVIFVKDFDEKFKLITNRISIDEIYAEEISDKKLKDENKSKNPNNGKSDEDTNPLSNDQTRENVDDKTNKESGERSVSQSVAFSQDLSKLVTDFIYNKVNYDVLSLVKSVAHRLNEINDQNSNEKTDQTTDGKTD